MTRSSVTDYLQSFTEAVAGGLEEAKALETYMMAMLKSLQNHHSQMAVSHEIALQTASDQIHTEAQVVTTQITAAVISFAALQNDLVGTTDDFLTTSR